MKRHTSGKSTSEMALLGFASPFETKISPGLTVSRDGTLPSFKLKFSLGFITSCYVIFSLSMVQAMDIFMIT